MNICSIKEVINMPGLDKTGPQGAGPKTGRGLGPCGGGQAYGRGGRGGRCYCGRYYSEPSKEEEVEMLEEDAKVLKDELSAVDGRLKELKGSK